MKPAIKLIPTSDLWTNTGQIPGVPRNPRLIKDDKYDKLVRSIKEDPEMLNLRELLVYGHAGQWIIIAGNMRFRAAMDAGLKSLPCKIIPEDTPAEKLRAIVIKDNIGYGEHDWDALANEWDEEQLSDWGLDLPASFGGNDEEDEPEERSFTPTFKFEVECKTEGEKNKLMAELLGRGITCTDDY